MFIQRYFAQRREKSSFLTGVGITARALSTSWGSVPRRSTRGFFRFVLRFPSTEKDIVDTSIRLIKIWLEVGMEEQEKRFKARIDDPLRQWKLSPMDLESFRCWYDYSRARHQMFTATNSKHAPWHVVHSDDKKRGRLNCISHILSLIPYKKIRRKKVKLPKRSNKRRYDDRASLKDTSLVPEKY